MTVRRTLTSLMTGIAIALAGAPTPSSAQDVADLERLSGLTTVDVRAEAQWDELITVEAGGATQGQFLQALQASFRDAIAEADAAPSVLDGAPVTVTCHVDTFYDTGLIVYSLRVQTEAAGADGQDVITWIKSSVGSYTVQQLHLMFRLGEQCADSFLEDWRAAN
ncbi:MAG: hypothetical protein HKN72_13580 [Gemmatimonadetes bacterium]|nr:hypothetical protein [Gemmatimonadota bacterium]NNL31416.1 hypothetical protein [Gemmatimonadota bacterium]